MICGSNEFLTEKWEKALNEVKMNGDEVLVEQQKIPAKRMEGARLRMVPVHDEWPGA
jgi:hypothetical protein